MVSRVLIKGGFIVSMDREIGNISNASLLVENGKITAIGRDIEADVAEIVDATHMIIMPGFVDTHRHIWQGPMRGVTSDWSLLNYLGGIRMNAASKFRPQDMYAAQLQGALEAIDAGVTTVADYCHNINTPDHAHEAIRGLKESGLRAVWCYGFNAPPLNNPAFNATEDRIYFGHKLAGQYFTHKDDLITLGIAPEEAPLWADDEAGKAQFHMARDFGARIFWHCNSINHNRQRPHNVSLLESLGLLYSDTVLVHMHYTTSEEWKLVAERGAAVSFTPDTELQMGMGYPSTVIAREHGIRFGYGTDIVSNNSADMFTPLRMALQLARAEINAPLDGEFPDGVPIECEEALRWGTIEGARALGLDDRIGSLTPGKDADIIMINTNSVGLVGWDQSNPAATIIQQASKADVDTVMVRGNILKRKGRIVADEQAVCRLLQQTADYICREVNKHGGFKVDPEKTFELIGGVTSERHAAEMKADYSA